MSKQRKLVNGGLYEIHWRDAVYYHHVEDVDPEDYKNGGEVLISTGYLLNHNKDSIILVAELRADRTPHRDVNLIPRCLITKAKRIRA